MSDLTRREFMGAAAAAASMSVLPRLSAAERVATRAFALPVQAQDAIDRDLLQRRGGLQPHVVQRPFDVLAAVGVADA